MKSEVKYLLDHGLAQASSSPWSSACILVPKSDKTFRFCTDYRKVNTVTKPDSYPLPRMEDCVDRVVSACFVTKLDLLKGYWQVPLTPHGAEISAFVTPDCFMQDSVMSKVLAGVQDCEVYLDDIVLHSSSWPSHLELLYAVFHRLCDRLSSLTLNLAKCEFGKATVVYLGKQVGQGEVCPVEAKVLAIVELPTPETKRELRRFLGMVGYYRSFCRNFSGVVLPFKLEVDASAAVLIQESPDGLDHPVCYFSKKFRTSLELQHYRKGSTRHVASIATFQSLYRLHRSTCMCHH